MSAKGIIKAILMNLNQKLLNLLLIVTNGAIYKILFNIISFLLVYKIKVLDNSQFHIKLKEKGVHNYLWICYLNRINYYLDGIDHRLKHLVEEEYLFKNFELSEDSIVFDIGANIGEIGVYLREIYNKKIEYHAFEASEFEYNACILNNNEKNDFINNYGIWNKSGKMQLYAKNKRGDSSLLKIEDCDSKTVINVDTIDNYVKRFNIKNIKLFKLEAEGGEPEVLEGAINTLPIIEFITADLGYERGIENKQTFTSVTNFLLSRGFQLVDINQLRLTALFRNKIFLDSS